MTPLQAARFYAARGLPTLPIEPFGKRPLTEHGVHDASLDPARHADWFSNHPERNIAIAVPSHWMIVDADARNGGLESLEEIERRRGPFPATLTARTGQAGQHLVYLRPASLTTPRGKIAPGVDLLCKGRYFLVAPSITAGAYRWTSRPGTKPVMVPDWLARIAQAEQSRLPEPRRHTDREVNAVKRAEAYVRSVPGAISGQGGHVATFKLAMRIAKGFGLDEAECFAIMSEWNQTCQPPWSRHDLIRKIKQAVAHGRMPEGALL